MYLFKILSLLLSISPFIDISLGQNPTAAPTIYTSCDRSQCKTYIANNTDWKLPSGDGCKTEVNGVTICVGCPNEAGQCECVSEKTDPVCAFVDAVADALKTWVIILIVIGVLCGVCIIGSIIYCICAGALCCAAVSK